MKKDIFTIAFPVFFAALNNISGFIFLGLLSRIDINYLAYFSIYHSFIVVLSQFFRLGADYEILSNSNNLKKKYNSSEHLISSIISINIPVLLILFFIKSLFLNNLITSILIGGSLFGMNVFFAYCFRSLKKPLLYSIFLNSPYILSLIISYFFSFDNTYSSINHFNNSLLILCTLQFIYFFAINKNITLNKIKFSEIKILFKNLKNIFSANFILLFLTEFPIFFFGVIGDLFAVSIYKLVHKLSSIIILISNQSFTGVITEIANRSPLANLLRVNDIIIEVQKTPIKSVIDLKKVVNGIFKKGEKTLLLTVINKNNRRRYLGVKIN